MCSYRFIFALSGTRKQSTHVETEDGAFKMLWNLILCDTMR